MEPEATSAEVMTTEEAAAYLRKVHGVEYHVQSLSRLANAGEIPSHKVGRYRKYRRSLLDKWALGEWTPDTEAA